MRYSLAMDIREKLKILDLTLKEEKVLLAVLNGSNTPLLLARTTKVTRPAVYVILKKLKKRGLVHTRIISGKKYWEMVRKEDIDQSLYEAKKVLLSISEGTEEVKGLSDGTVIVHRGKEAIKELITTMLKGHKREWFYTMQGDAVQKGWDEVVGQEGINDFNEYLKKNDILTKIVLPFGWFEDQANRLGPKAAVAWVKGFIDRAHSAVQVDEKYFDHGGQIFIFRNSLYLMSLNEALVVEIRNSELKKLITQMFAFMEDNANRFNMNEQAQKLIVNLEKIESSKTKEFTK